MVQMSSAVVTQSVSKQNPEKEEMLLCQQV